MTEHPRHLDRDTAERLLDGAGATPEPGTERLAHLLASAAAPSHPQELSGEDAAVMAFRAAAAGRKRGFSWRRLLTFKALAAAGAAVAAGGLAFASTSGVLPNPFAPGPLPSATRQQPPVTTSVAGTVTPGAQVSPLPTPSAVPPADTAALAGLCQAYQAKPPSEKGKALETPAFAPLVTAAGGPDKVDAYCEGVAAGKPEQSHPGKPSTTPTHPGPPTRRP